MSEILNIRKLSRVLRTITPVILFIFAHDQQAVLAATEPVTQPNSTTLLLENPHLLSQEPLGIENGESFQLDASLIEAIVNNCQVFSDESEVNRAEINQYQTIRVIVTGDTLWGIEIMDSSNSKIIWINAQDHPARCRDAIISAIAAQRDQPASSPSVTSTPNPGDDERVVMPTATEGGDVWPTPRTQPPEPDVIINPGDGLLDQFLAGNLGTKSVEIAGRMVRVSISSSGNRMKLLPFIIHNQETVKERPITLVRLPLHTLVELVGLPKHIPDYFLQSGPLGTHRRQLAPGVGTMLVTVGPGQEHSEGIIVQPDQGPSFQLKWSEVKSLYKDLTIDYSFYLRLHKLYIGTSVTLLVYLAVVWLISISPFESCLKILALPVLFGIETLAGIAYALYFLLYY